MFYGEARTVRMNIKNFFFLFTRCSYIIRIGVREDVWQIEQSHKGTYQEYYFYGYYEQLSYGLRCFKIY